MNHLKRYFITGTLICAAGVCAYQFLLNDKAKKQLGKSINTIRGSIKQILKYQEILVDDGTTNTELLREHQERISNSWKELGY